MDEAGATCSTPSNVRGLESPDRKFFIKCLFNLFQSMDVFMMQEIKAVGFILESNLNFIWKEAIKFSLIMTEEEEEFPSLLTLNGENSLLIMVAPLARELFGLLFSMIIVYLEFFLSMPPMTLKKELLCGIG